MKAKSASASAMSTSVPILLLPVRLETRYVTGEFGTELWVRIYPDQIHVNSHDPMLTAVETDHGRTYWNEVGRLTALDDPVGPWRVLAIAHGPRRAAYIRLQTQPQFDAPTTAAAAASSHPSPTATLLPSSWEVTAYIRGGAVRRATSYVAEGISVGELPLFPDPNFQHHPELGTVDPNTKWMIDFNTAVQNGVAVRIHLEPADVAAGIERVVALGLCDGDANVGARAFGALIDDHHYTQGFAMVPQGSATKNTPDSTAAFSKRDPTFANSYRVEVKGGLAANVNGNGQVLAAGLGIEGTYFQSIDHSEGHDQENARHMAAALWPSTVGYFLRQMMADVLDDTHVNLVRDFFVGNVRARGRLPAVRVGPVPYGVLPATALNRWNQPNASAVERKLVDLIAAVRPTWALSSLNTPRVGAGRDPDQALVGILGMEASSMDFHARAVLGDEFLWNWLNFLGFNFGQGAGWWLPHMQSADAAFSKLGLGQFNAVIRRAGFLGGFGISLDTVATTLSEVDGLDKMVTLPGVNPDGTPRMGNYIQWITQTSIDDLAAERWPGPGPAPTALLYKTLRASMLLEYSRASVKLLVAATLAPPALIKEIILHEIGGLHRGINAWTSLELAIPGVTGAQSIKAYIQSPQSDGDAQLADLRDLKASLEYLATLPTAELDRLLTETLDASSHRLDAWASGLANAILDRNRLVHNRGLYVGGYGYVENLAPAPAAPSTTTDPIPGTLVRQAHVDNAGYVQAPSLQQAALAAVLRSGYLSHAKTGNADLLNLDISSDRVRRALWYLDGVRKGQKLGALLGFHFEEGLHNAGLDTFVQPFRDAYPLAVPVTDPSGILPAGTTSAPNVVDGVALQDAHATHKLDVDTDWGSPGLPSAHGDQVAVTTIFADLDDVMNSISNLSVAESVFQVMRGNSVRASGLLDAASRGDWAPEPEFLDTRRTGIDISHRVLVVFTADHPIGTNWPNPRTARGTLEPRVDDWCAKLLPDPTTVKCSVHYTHNGAPVSMSFSLKDLGVGPLDVLSMANAGTEPGHSELEQRILYRADLPAGTGDAQIVFSNPGAGVISFPELLTAAAAVRDLVFGARGLQPNDLSAPEEADAKQEVQFIADLLKRADDTLAAIDTLEKNLAAHIATLAGLLDPTRLPKPTRAQLDAAATDVANDLLALLPYGAPGSVPLPRHRQDPTMPAGAGEIQALLEHATAADTATKKRVSTAKAYRDANLKDSQHVAEATSFFTKVMDGTVPALPRFQAKNSADLQFAFDPTRALVPAAQPDAVDKWLQQLTYVRPPIARLDAALAAGQLLSTPPYAPAHAIGQLPKQADPDTWVGLEFAGTAPTRGRLAMLALLEPSPYQPAGTHSGLVIDEWPERIPQTKETSGLAFHYEEPKSRAPQCMLLAVAPNAAVANWENDTLRDIVIETFAWADLRTVDPDSLGDFGAILPALYFGLNTGFGGAPDAVSTDFGGPR